MAKGGGGGGGKGGSGGAGGRSAGGGGGAAANAPLTGAQAAKELKKMGLDVDGASAKDIEKTFGNLFLKAPTAAELHQLVGASQLGGKLQGSIKFGYDHRQIQVDAFGRQGVTLSRTLSNYSGETRAYHASLFLQSGLQKTGLGKRIVRDQVRSYQKLGVKQVNLHAAEVGRYAWAKFGFNGDAKTVRGARREFAQYLRKENVPNAARIVRDAKTLHDIAVTKVRGRQVGKEFLLQGKTRDMSLRVDAKDKGFKIFKKEVGL